MTLEQIKAEQRMLEAQIDLAVRHFMKRCGLAEWQVTASFGQAKISINDGPAQSVYEAAVSVRV